MAMGLIAAPCVGPVIVVLLSWVATTGSLFLGFVLAGTSVMIANKGSVNHYMLLLAAFQVLLHRYTAQEDILVGTPIANRQQPELSGLIGFFVNTLVLRVELGGDPRVVELLGRVRESALEAYAHQELPFEKLVEALEPARDRGLRQPSFQCLPCHGEGRAAGTGGRR